jgi:hypothetical protein
VPETAPPGRGGATSSRDHEPAIAGHVNVRPAGAIADRSAERLGRSDAAVVLLRKIWKRELRLLAEGKPLTQLTFPRFVEPSGAVAGLDLRFRASDQAQLG